MKIRYLAYPKQGLCKIVRSGPQNGTPKIQKSYENPPKTGVDVDFCAAVPKMRSKIFKNPMEIRYFGSLNMGHIDFCALCRFGTPNFKNPMKIRYFGSKKVLCRA